MLITKDDPQWATQTSYIGLAGNHITANLVTTKLYVQRSLGVAHPEEDRPFRPQTP